MRIPVSPVLAMVPFLEYNDGTRLQMASSQCKQAVPLVENEMPIVQSTLETQTVDQNLFSPDIVIAKQAGRVIFSSSRLILVRYEDNSYDYWRISEMHEVLPISAEFDRGEIIAQIPSYFQDYTLSQGRNLVIASMTHPYTYEDAMVISERTVEKMKAYQVEKYETVLTPDSILLGLDDSPDYKILPKPGETYKANQPFLRIKKISSGNVFEKPKEIKYNKAIEILEVVVFPTEWNRTIREYSVRMKEIQLSIQKKRKQIENLDLNRYMLALVENTELLFNSKRIYQNKARFKGVYIKIVYRYIEDVSYGDKFSNRYANKSTLAYIAPEGSLPSMDGIEADVVVSPMSIISRMNIGQLYESYASGCIHFLKKKLKNTKDANDAKELVMKFYSTIDNTQDKRITSEVEKWLEQSSYDTVINADYTFPAPPFESSTKKQLLKAAKIVDYPVFFGKDKIHMGYMYFYRLVHIARHKIAARSVGLMSKKTMQPLSGTGAQRLGEMEVWNLLAYDARYNIREMLTTKSDDIERKINLILKTVYEKSLPDPKTTPESVKLLQAYFSILGTDLKV